MKFLQLEILNLASLDKQGGEVINFEEGAFRREHHLREHRRVRRGKWQVHPLDAICLALYNRAPRYPKKERRQESEHRDFRRS